MMKRSNHCVPVHVGVIEQRVQIRQELVTRLQCLTWRSAHALTKGCWILFLFAKKYKLAINMAPTQTVFHWNYRVFFFKLQFYKPNVKRIYFNFSTKINFGAKTQNFMFLQFFAGQRSLSLRTYNVSYSVVVSGVRIKCSKLHPS